MFPSEIQNLRTYYRLVIQDTYLKLYVQLSISNNFLAITWLCSLALEETRKLSCLSIFHRRHHLLGRRYALWGSLLGWMLVRLGYQGVKHKHVPSILDSAMGEVVVAIVVLWYYNELVCATFGHEGDGQQKSCNLYSVAVAMCWEQHIFEWWWRLVMLSFWCSGICY